MPAGIVLGLMVLAAGLAFCAGMIYAVRRERRSHQHDWDVRGVQGFNYYSSDTERAEWQKKHGLYERKVTRVLWGCRRCRARETQHLDGHWTMEQVCRIRQKAEGFASPWDEGVKTR